MKTIASYPAMTVVDLEQEIIEIRDIDCDWLNPDRRVFCTEFKAVRGDTLFNAVTPGNIWESHERDGRADRIPAALERAEQHGHEKYWFNSDAVCLSNQPGERETWHLLREGQIVTMRGARFVIRVGHRGAVRLEAAPDPVLDAPVLPADAVAPAPRPFLQYGDLVAALESGPVRIGSISLEKGASRYLMRDERSGQAHSLEISETDPVRLTAHWLGFVTHAQTDPDDMVIRLPVLLPNGRGIYDCDKVALIDYLDNLASAEGHPLHGLEFRIYHSPSGVTGGPLFWGDRDKIRAAGLFGLVSDFLANRPANRFTVTLPRPVSAELVDVVRAYFVKHWNGAPVAIEHGDALAVVGMAHDDPAAHRVKGALLAALESITYLAEVVEGIRSLEPGQTMDAEATNGDYLVLHAVRNERTGRTKIRALKGEFEVANAYPDTLIAELFTYKTV
ncbi:hypothetical protein Ah13B_03 [Aeromonas phage AhMtk13b]|nr:hypothetical protein Ah13B_03 [Aeromonas phage AhMtk13b]